MIGTQLSSNHGKSGNLSSSSSKEKINAEYDNLTNSKDSIVSVDISDDPNVETLNQLQDVIERYKAEERSISHLYTKLLNPFQLCEISLDNHDLETNLENAILKMKNFVKDPKNLHVGEKAIQEIEKILSKEELARLVIHHENNNEGILSLGNNTIEFLETIRIFLFDETSKNFMVSVNDTTLELFQRIIGKISCLEKDLNNGYSLWEVPHGMPGKERKLLNNDLPVLLKRSWRRPSRFYFLTLAEEELKFKSDGRRKRVSSAAPPRTKAKVPNGVSVKVVYESNCFKSFFIFENEKGKEFKTRALLKLSDVMTIDPLHTLFLSENNDMELKDDENVHQLFSNVTDGKLILKLRKESKPVSSLDRRRIEALNDQNKSKLSFIGLRLDEVPEDIQSKSQTVVSLDLSYNNISVLPEWLSNFKNLKVLNLSSNKLTHISKCLSLISKLQILDLSQNDLKSLDDSLFNMQGLKSLYLSNNNITELPKEFANLNKLEELTLAGNKLAFNDKNDNLRELTFLRMLDLSSNDLPEIPSFVYSIATLEELYITTNKISIIHESLYSLIHLRTLDLSGNIISSIPPGINKLLQLQDLLLDGNPFKNVNIEELEEMEQLRVIKLPNCQDEELLQLKLNSLQERRITKHRSTMNASVMDILIGQTIDLKEMETESKGKSSEKVKSKKKDKIVKSSSLPSDEFNFYLEKSDKPEKEEKRKSQKKQKFPLKKFATESQITTVFGQLIKTSSSAFNLELGRDHGLSKPDLFSPMNLKLEYNQDDYFTNFHGIPHFNYLAMDKQYGPSIISILNMKEIVNKESCFRALIKNKEGDTTIWIPFDQTKTHKKSKLAIQTKLFSCVQEKLKEAFSHVKLVEEQEYVDDILFYESRISSNAFKFGVIYAGKESTEESMYNIRNGSEEFDKFLNFLGERINLKGWTNYCAGLDVENDRTGKWSIYQRWSTTEIMFHVSTYLPYVEDDEQQIERKKHIGNDIVVIIFQDEDAPSFDPSVMKSFFNHVFIVVRPIKSIDGIRYSIAIASKEGVQSHTPQLPRPSTFESGPQLRKFLFTKLINGERASYFAPSFSKALGRAREQLLNEIYKKYTTGERKGKLKKIKV